MRSAIIIASLFASALVLAWADRLAPCGSCSDVVAVLAANDIGAGGCR